MAGTISQASYNAIVSQAAKQGINAGTVASKASSLGITTTQPVAGNVMSGNLTTANKIPSTGTTNPFTGAPLTTTTTGNTGQNTTVSPNNSPVVPVVGGPLTKIGPTSQITPTTPKVDTTTQATLPGDVFGAAAIAKEKLQPGYMDLRNTKIATTLQKAGVTDETGVKQFLETQPGFTQADPTQQANTIANVVKAMGITPAATPTPAAILPTGFVAALSSMAQASGFASVADMKAQLGSDFSDLAQYYPTDNDPEKVNLFNSMLQGMINAKRTEVGASANSDANMQAIETNYGVGGDVVAADRKQIQNGLDTGLNITQIAGKLGKPVSYVTDLLQGKPQALPDLSAEQQTKATQYLSAAQDERQTVLDQQKRDAGIQLQNLTQDYQENMTAQTAANQQTDAGMSHIAAATGSGMTDSGIAAIDYAHQQGLKALQDIQKTMDRGSVQIANQLNDAVDAFNYNTKLYNMYYSDAIDSAKSGFFQEMQKVQTQYGNDINAYYTSVQGLAKTFLDNTTQINKDRADLQMKANDQLMQIQRDAVDANYKQESLNLQSQAQQLNVAQEQYAETGQSALSGEGSTTSLDIPRTGTNVGVDTNNFGNITSSAPGSIGMYQSPNGRSYAVFANAQDGYNALVSDINAKCSGNSTKCSPSTTAADFLGVWVNGKAGSVTSDSSYYKKFEAQVGANNMNKPISSIDPNALAKGIMAGEGTLDAYNKGGKDLSSYVGQGQTQQKALSPLPAYKDEQVKAVDSALKADKDVVNFVGYVQPAYEQLKNYTVADLTDSKQGAINANDFLFNLAQFYIPGAKRGITGVADFMKSGLGQEVQHYGINLTRLVNGTSTLTDNEAKGLIAIADKTYNTAKQTVANKYTQDAAWLSSSYGIDNADRRLNDPTKDYAGIGNTTDTTQSGNLTAGFQSKYSSSNNTAQ